MKTRTVTISLKDKAEVVCRLHQDQYDQECNSEAVSVQFEITHNSGWKLASVLLSLVRRGTPTQSHALCRSE